MIARVRRNRRGVTLVELLVALAVLGFMTAIGSTVFGTIIDDRIRLETASSDVERASALRDLIYGWLSAATVSTAAPTVPASAGGGVTAVRITLDGTTPAINPAAPSGDQLNFVTRAPNPAQSPEATMRLFVDDDPSTPEVGLTLEYKAGGSTQYPWGRIQLDPSIGTLIVEFLDNRTNQWYGAADATGIQAKAVRVTMYGAEGSYYSGIVSLPMIQSMPLPAGAAAQAGGGG